MINVLVTGGNGQLASSIKAVSSQKKSQRYVFVDIDELDITDPLAVAVYFSTQEFDYCINCAAYTAVDKAEADSLIANLINTKGAENLAVACREHNTTLIQISTDFVFDGNKSRPYTEEDTTTPLNIYGHTKLAGEIAVREMLDAYFIIRTSWLYSEYGNNFLKTMLKLGQERDELKVISDQIGTPTYAGDLAELIVKIITEDLSAYGVYHYSNEGVASWYDFARYIFELSGLECEVIPIPAESYPTAAIRPSYSVLDKSKVKETFNIAVPYWRDSLKLATDRLHKNQGE